MLSRASLGVLLLVASAFAALRSLSWAGGTEQTLEYLFRATLSPAEAWSFAVLWSCTALGAWGAWLILSVLPAFSMKSLPRLSEPQRKLVLLFLSLLSVLVATGLRAFVTEGAVFSDDEYAYLFSSEMLLRGELTIPTSSRIPIHGFLVETHDAKMGAIFPPGVSVLIALGALFGSAHLLQAIACGAIAWLTGVIAGQLERGGKGVSLRAAGLMACSPLLLFHAATLHNVVPATALGLGALSAFLQYLQRPRAWLLLLSGLLVGLTAVVRPDTGGVVAVALAAGVLAESSFREILTRGSLLALAFALGAMPLLWSYQQFTGDPLQGPYALWLEQHHSGTRLFGFGITPFGWEQTLAASLTKTTAYLARVGTWWLGGAPWLLILAVVPFVSGGLTRRWSSLVTLLVLHQFVVWLYTLPSVHDFGSAYHVFSAPALCILAASGWRHLEERSPNALRAAFAHALAIVIVFWPFAVLRSSATAQRINAPIALAQAEAEAGDIAVLWRYMHGGLVSSWVFYPPLSPYPEEQPVLWLPLTDTQGSELRALIGERRLFLLQHRPDTQPLLVPIAVDTVGRRE